MRATDLFDLMARDVQRIIERAVLRQDKKKVHLLSCELSTYKIGIQ